MIETRQECGHLLLWRAHPPTSGHRIWCSECKDMRKVLSRTGEWSAHCTCGHWRKTYAKIETLRDRVAEHIRKCGNPVLIANHDQTERYTVRTSHYAESVGSHTASDPTKTRVLPRSPLRGAGGDTLF